MRGSEKTKKPGALRSQQWGGRDEGLSQILEQTGYIEKYCLERRKLKNKNKNQAKTNKQASKKTNPNQELATDRKQMYG